jgi:MFS family permease
MNLLNYIDRFILQALLSPVANDRDLLLNDTQAGVLVSAFFISYTVCSPLGGWFGDRMPRRRLLAIGVGVWSLATFGTGLAHSFGQIILARGLLGVGEATYAVLTPALISDLFPREKRNTALTIFYLAIPIGAALGYGLGAELNAWFGWRAAFYVVGLPGLAVAVSALFLPDPPRGAAEGVSEKERAEYEALPLSWPLYATLLRNRSFICNTLGMAMTTFALGGLQAWTPSYLAPGGEKEEVAAVGLRLGVVVAASGFAGTALGWWLGERLKRRWQAAYFWVCGLGTLGAIPFILASLLSRDDVVVYAMMGVGLTLAFFNFGPSNTILVNVTSPKIRAAAVAVNLFLIHMLGDIPSPFIMGRLSDSLVGGGLTRKAGLFWAEALTVPALLLSGLFFCWGARYLKGDQDAVLRGMRA